MGSARLDKPRLLLLVLAQVDLLDATCQTSLSAPTRLNAKLLNMVCISHQYVLVLQAIRELQLFEEDGDGMAVRGGSGIEFDGHGAVGVAVSFGRGPMAFI